MDTEESATHNDAQTNERKTIKQRAPEEGVEMPESAHVDTIVEQLKNDTERLVKQIHEAVMTLEKQNHDKIAATLSATFVNDATSRQCTFREIETKIEGSTNALRATQARTDARIDALEKSKSSSSSGNRKRNEQN